MTADFTRQIAAPTREIIAALRRAGHTAWLAGGCVRDMLLGVAPVDFDIATSATPKEVAAIFPKTLQVGAAFGVSIVIDADGRQHELAQFRGESAYHDGRHPEKVYAAAEEEDARRRDLTINALFYNPATREVIDYVGGQKDLAARVVRAVGDAPTRFTEDHLRLLRAVRFAARFNFTIEAATFQALRELAGYVRLLSAERRGAELLKILLTPQAATGLQLLEGSYLLRHLLPEVAALRGLPQPREFHPEGDVFTHTKIMLEKLPEALAVLPDDFSREVLAWATLLHDIGKAETLSFQERPRFHQHDERGAAMAHDCLTALKRPKKVAAAVADLIKRHIHFAALAKMRPAKRRRFLQEPLFPLHLALHRLDCLASHGDLRVFEYAQAQFALEQKRPPPLPPFLTGADLLDLGFAPGPRFKVLLRQAADLQLEGKLADKAAARAWAAAQPPEPAS